MGIRAIIGSICAGYLIGVFIAHTLYSNDPLLTVELFTIEIQFGLCSAAIIGIIACCIDYWMQKLEDDSNWRKTPN
jgi:hypothetical protein